MVPGTNKVGFAAEDEGGLAASPDGQQHGKIRVGGNNHSLFVPGPFQNDQILRGMKTVVTNVNGIVAHLSQKPRHFGRECIIDQESHAVRGITSSRSIAEAAAKRRHSRMSSN